MKFFDHFRNLRRKRSVVPAPTTLPFEMRVNVGEYAADISVVNTGPIVFCFDNMGSAGPIQDRAGWSYEFLKGRHVNVVSFLETSSKAWYRRKSFLSLIGQVSDLIEDFTFSKRFGYGGSMGGYAASAYAGLLNCDEVVLYNPISTLNRVKAPWEKRYREARRMDWKGHYHDGVEGIANVEKVHIVVDPLFHPDRLHVERFLSVHPAVHVLKVPGVGHYMPRHLKNLGILSTYALAKFRGDADIDKSLRTAIRKRREYARYYKWLLSRENTHLTPKRAEVIVHHYAKWLMATGKQPRKVIGILQNIEDTRAAEAVSRITKELHTLAR